MKKWTIWLLVIVMALTFGSLIYIQILYMEQMTRMHDQRFDENVKLCLNNASQFLEREETKHYLIEDIGEIESALFNSEYNTQNPTGVPHVLSPAIETEPRQDLSPMSDNSRDIGQRYQWLQRQIRDQYVYQRGLLNELILTILRESGNRSAFERADSTLIRQYLTSEFANNGIKAPFEFAIANNNDVILYSTKKFDPNNNEHIFSQPLFPRSANKLKLLVDFPERQSYLQRSLKYYIPAMAFTLMLLVLFVYTMVRLFRQKKLSEMKTDFINNMTHELKTPISSISLAAQMLEDPSVSKSPAMMQQLSTVIGDESKRLRFQVEKVLQMSMFEHQQPNLKMTEVNANDTINSVVNTFRLKVERFGGKIETDLEATDDMVLIDSMHFTNVLFNLMDNAVKYRDLDREPVLKIRSWNPNAQHISISISDNGIGIRKDDLKRIFEKFYRVNTGNRHDVKGFGLGLAYVKRMITEFAGKITVESEPGKGTTFTITLPLEEMT